VSDDVLLMVQILEQSTLNSQSIMPRSAHVVFEIKLLDFNKCRLISAF
jgi:hypothetical protein